MGILKRWAFRRLERYYTKGMSAEQFDKWLDMIKIGSVPAGPIRQRDPRDETSSAPLTVALKPYPVQPPYPRSLCPRCQFNTWVIDTSPRTGCRYYCHYHRDVTIDLSGTAIDEWLGKGDFAPERRSR